MSKEKNPYAQQDRELLDDWIWRLREALYSSYYSPTPVDDSGLVHAVCVALSDAVLEIRRLSSELEGRDKIILGGMDAIVSMSKRRVR